MVKSLCLLTLYLKSWLSLTLYIKSWLSLTLYFSFGCPWHCISVLVVPHTVLQFRLSLTLYFSFGCPWPCTSVLVVPDTVFQFWLSLTLYFSLGCPWHCTFSLGCPWHCTFSLSCPWYWHCPFNIGCFWQCTFSLGCPLRLVIKGINYANRWCYQSRVGCGGCAADKWVVRWDMTEGRHNMSHYVTWCVWPNTDKQGPVAARKRSCLLCLTMEVV